MRIDAPTTATVFDAARERRLFISLVLAALCGLRRGEITALRWRSVDLETGQLAVIALAYLAVGIWGRNRAWYRPRVVIPASATVAAVGLFWTVQRALGS